MSETKKIPAADDPRFEALLTDAARELAAEQEQEADLLVRQFDGAREFDPSPGHLAEMQALLQRAAKPQKRRGKGRAFLQWAACMTLAVCIGSALFPTQTAAVWHRLRSFVYRVHTTHTEIHISTPESVIEPSPSTDDFTPVRPSYIPAGFVCTEEKNLTIMSFAGYEKGEQRIHFQQMFADGTGIGLDTENAYTEQAQVNEMEALYVEKEVNGVVHRTLLYHDEVYIYLLSGDDLPRKELFKIAESVPSA